MPDSPTLADIRKLLVRRDAQAKRTVALLGHQDPVKMVYMILTFIEIDRVDEMIELWEGSK